VKAEEEEKSKPGGCGLGFLDEGRWLSVAGWEKEWPREGRG
jgi:hypothetical protein